MTGQVAWPGPLPRLIGHRGAAAVAPENTLAGLRAAATAGAVWVEVDARLTGDNVPVLMHDATLDRTTNGKGRVREIGHEALSALDAGAWFGAAFAGEPVPSLGRALDLADKIGLYPNIELKHDPDTVEATGEIVARALAGRGGPVLVSCFDAACLAVARATNASLPLALNADRLTGESLAAAVGLGCAALHVGIEGATAAVFGEIHAAGMAAGVFTVNDPAEARRLRTAGADYLFTDDPGGLASF